MTWFRPIGTLELILLGAFIIFYILYILRTARISKALNRPFPPVFFKFILRNIYFGLLIVALLGPSFGESSRELKMVGKDIFFLVDLSESMNANDIKPSRLDKIKYELKNIVDAFSSDRVGIIMFSNEAFMQCPLTFDKSAVNLFIETLSTGLVPNTGTDFAPALNLSIDKLSNEESSATRQTAKIVILISDGEDHGKETIEAVEKLEERGIKLFTLGVGTQKGSKIPKNRGFKRDRSGKDIVTRLNPKSLKSIAVQSGGKYFEIGASRNDVSRLISAIDGIEGEVQDVKKMDVKSNKYMYFLGLALLLIVFDILFSIKIIKI